MTGLDLSNWIDLLTVLALLVVGILVVRPGLRLYQNALIDDESETLRLQVTKLGDEVLRLQVMVDDQAREIGGLKLELDAMQKSHQMDIANLKGAQRMLLENAKRLSSQVRQAGQEPSVDVEALAKLLP